jgi:membrane fusion protein (multidrug efflux system)
MSDQQKRRSILLVILIGLGVLAYWYYQQDDVISTENAYIKSDHVYISSRVNGMIVEVEAEQHKAVKKGDLLFRIDPSVYDLKIEQLEAERQTVALEINHQKQTLHELDAQRSLALEDLRFAREEYEREKNLVGKGLITERDIAARLHSVNKASHALSLIDADIATALSDLKQNPDLPLESHPKYIALMKQLSQAEQDLAFTYVRAPIDGLLIDKPVVGTYAERGRPITSIVDVDKVWAEANFLETDMAGLRIGQSAVVEVAAYPGKLWKGKVSSFSPATGAEFAILPPQNATGNWVKVTQRIPVRIDLDSTSDELILRKGMTVTVKVFPSGLPQG